jgi:hypothetical protein
MTRTQDGKNSYEVIGITEMYPKNCRYLPGTSELEMEGCELFLSELTSFSKRDAALYINKKLKSEEIKFNVFCILVINSSSLFGICIKTLYAVKIHHLNYIGFC